MSIHPLKIIKTAKRLLLKIRGGSGRPEIVAETDDERDKKQRDLEDDDRDYKKKDEEPYDEDEDRLDEDDEDENDDGKETPAEKEARMKRLEAIQNYANIRGIDIDEAAEELEMKAKNPFQKPKPKTAKPQSQPKQKVDFMKKSIYEAGGTPQVVSTIAELRKIQSRIGALQEDRRAANIAQETAYGQGGAWAVRDYEQNPKRLTDDELRFAIIDMQNRQTSLPDWQARQAFGMDVIGKFKKEVGQARWEMEYQRAHRAAFNTNQNPVTLRKQTHTESILEQQAERHARTGKPPIPTHYQGYR